MPIVKKILKSYPIIIRYILHVLYTYIHNKSFGCTVK